MTPPRRQIRWAYPKGGGFGVGDTFLFTPVCRQADVTWEIPVDSFCASDLASILQSVARIEYVHTPITEPESLALYASQYGQPPQTAPLVNAAQGYLARYGLDTRDCIPAALPPACEVEWARRWLKQWRNPVVFTPVPGGLSNPADEVARSKWVPPLHWEPTLRRLSAHHDLLYFTARNHYVPFPIAIPLLGFSMAKVAAVQHVCRRHLGVENGLLHMAVAMGAECWVGLPTADLNHQSFRPYIYAEHQWGSQPNRVSYAPLTGPNQAVRNLSFP